MCVVHGDEGGSNVDQAHQTLGATQRGAGHPVVTIRSPQNLVGGLALIALALGALWAGSDLEIGRTMRMGPGYLPRVLAILIGACGILITARSAIVEGPGLEAWGLRRLALVLGAVVLFALGIRPLGLVVTGTLLVCLASSAAPDARWLETAIFAAAIVLFVSLLFPIALGLPLPLWPTGLAR